MKKFLSLVLAASMLISAASVVIATEAPVEAQESSFISEDSLLRIENDRLISISDVAGVLKNIAGWHDISLGNVRMVFENKQITTENDDVDLQLFFTSVIKLQRVTLSSHPCLFV